MIIDSHNVIHPDLQTPGDLLADMDRTGIDKALVYCARGKFYDNDYTAAAVRRHADRLIGLAYISPQHENALDELHRARDLGLVGIALDPKHEQYSLSIGSHWFMDSIFAACQEEKLVVLVEGWGDHHNSMPYQLRDVAWTFPDLVMILAHMGMMGGYDDVHRVAQTCANVYINTSTTTTSQVTIAVKIAGTEKVLLGTNTPYEYFEVGLKKVEIGIPDPAQRARVLGTNLAQLLGIKTQVGA
jgi:predicted TIM-barrel fold metal-dependent hydrolase